MEGRREALLAVCACVDLNPVRSEPRRDQKRVTGRRGVDWREMRSLRDLQG